jgi:hypothetical protein
MSARFFVGILANRVRGISPSVPDSALLDLDLLGRKQARVARLNLDQPVVSA